MASINRPMTSVTLERTKPPRGALAAPAPSRWRCGVAPVAVERRDRGEILPGRGVDDAPDAIFALDDG